MRKNWIGLAVLALPTLLVSIDVFVMLLALPHMAADLGADGTQQLWIMDVYGFMLSGFLVTMGTLGDRIGRRRLLLIGATAFGLASLVAAYAPTPELLIAARGLLGIAGATLAPSTLALVSNLFTDAKQRGLAIGIWFACFMGGAVLGPVVGGLLLTHFWWGSAFLLGVPAMVLLLILGPVLLPEYRDAAAGRLDLFSVGLSLATILPVVYGLKETAKAGWAPLPALSIVVGLGVGVLFVRRQRALADPLIDLRLFGNRAFTTALGGMFAGTMLMGAMMMFIAQYLQLVKALSPLAAGLWMLPAAAASGLSFVVSPLLARRIRAPYLIGAGLALSVAGMSVIAQVSATAAPIVIASAFAVINFGAGPLVTLTTGFILGSAPPEKAGSAASMNETSGELGYALGIAILGTIGAAVYRSRTGGQVLAGDDVVPHAFTASLHTVATIAAVLLAGVAILMTMSLPKEAPAASPSS